jgi:hypothetical protein
VRQGQIAELINAKPKNRRRILEDAAGISGLYQRRHEAELKLKGAEQNLARVDDVLEQLAGQLASARPAGQAGGALPGHRGGVAPTAPPRRSHPSRRASRSFPGTSSGRPRSTLMRARP